MAKDKMLLYGGLALGAWLLLSRRGSVAYGASLAGPFVAKDNFGSSFSGTFPDFASAKAFADARNSIQKVDIFQYPSGVSPVYSNSGPVLGAAPGGGDPTGNGWDWDPTHSPYFGDVVSGIGSFFGL